MKQKLEQLARLKIEQRKIEAEIEEIYPEILEEVKDMDDGTVIEMSEGTFTVSFRRTWTYTEELEKKAEALKIAKKEEEQKGLATYTTKPSVIFKQVYEKE